MSIQDSVNSALNSVANAVQTNKILGEQKLENELRKIQVQETTTKQRNDIISGQNDLKDLDLKERTLTEKLDQANSAITGYNGKRQTKSGSNTKKYQTLLDAANEAGGRLDEIINMKRTLSYDLNGRIATFNARADAYTKAGIKVARIGEEK